MSKTTPRPSDRLFAEATDVKPFAKSMECRNRSVLRMRSLAIVVSLHPASLEERLQGVAQGMGVALAEGGDHVLAGGQLRLVAGARVLALVLALGVLRLVAVGLVVTVRLLEARDHGEGKRALLVGHDGYEPTL